MTPPPADGVSRSRGPVLSGPLLLVAGLPLALAIGLAAGVPAQEFRVMGLASLGVLAATIGALWPWVALQTIFFSSFFLICYLVTETRAANPIDIFLFPVIFGSVYGGVRAAAKREIAARTNPAHEPITVATRRIARRVVIFYGIAWLSLIALAVRGHPAWALDSSLSLLRAHQGVTFFVLGLWWIRTGRHLRVALRTIEVAAWALLAANVYFFSVSHIGRAGQTWVMNLPDWPMSSPNDLGTTILFVWAMLQSLPAREQSWDRKLLMVGLIVLLVMSQSRSGLLAFTIFNVLTVRWLRWRTLLTAATLGVLALLLVPDAYWARLARTFAIGGGSFDAYTSLVRVYGWQVAVRVFLDNPIFGVGYVGFRFVSSAYNDLRIIIGPAESFYLEVAADMGVPGLIALAAVFLALIQLGPAVQRGAPAGSIGARMAGKHIPLMLALFVVILTGNNLVGLTCLSQLSIWCSFLIRAGHLSIDAPRT